MTAPVALLFDAPPEKGFDRITRPARALLDAPVSLLSRVDPGRRFFKSLCGLTTNLRLDASAIDACAAPAAA